MKQFKIILAHEFTNFLKNKVFVGITVFLVVVLAGIMFFPRIRDAFSSGNPGSAEPEPGIVDPGTPADPGEWEPQGPILLLSGSYADGVEDALRYGLDYQVQKGNWTAEEASEKILAGEAGCALIFDSPTHFTYYVETLPMYDDSDYLLNEAILNTLKMRSLTDKGLSADEAAGILSMNISHDTEVLGKDQFSNFFYTYAMIFGLYMVILLYGQMVASNVASEKSSRAMELLVTSARPTAMMFGKVIASCLAGLLQLTLIFGSALVFYRLNEEYLGGNPIIVSLFNFPASLLFYMLLFFVLGFFLYAFMYGAVGSTASKLEDINISVMPITMIFLAGFFVVIFSMSSGRLDNGLMKAASFIPFTSPMAMFTRICMSTVPPFEIVLSVAILIASVILVGVLAARIYRIGVLMYGKPPKIGELLKMVTRK